MDGKRLKDLLRFLGRDDPQMRVVFKQVCKWNIVANDLIPFIEHCLNGRNLVLNSGKGKNRVYGLHVSSIKILDSNFHIGNCMRLIP